MAPEISKPRRLRLCSEVRKDYPEFEGRVQAGAQTDELVSNWPYAVTYHVVVCGAKGEPLYDLGGHSEPKGAIIIPVDKDGNIGLLKQWRSVPASDPSAETYPLSNVQAHGFMSLELPRGYPDSGERPETAACREAEEEMQAKALRAIQLGWCNSNTSVMLSDIPVFAVLMTTEVAVSVVRDEAEYIENVSWLGVPAVQELIAERRIRCGLTLAALSYAFSCRSALETLREVG